jgi:small conductance mechanosensitive channel
MIGALGFVVGFALKDSLSNFANGLLILGYRPFDVGDFVEAGGVLGTVESLNLVSTTIKTPDNKVMIVPNNTVWNGIITNITGSAQRRVDLTFGVSYSDDLDKVQEILERVVQNHPKVLKDPAPLIKVHELADSSVNFICWPWAKTSDWGEVRWDLIRTVKQEFDKAGISIPFPQTDVHLFRAEGAKSE